MQLHTLTGVKSVVAEGAECQLTFFVHQVKVAIRCSLMGGEFTKVKVVASNLSTNSWQ